MPFTPGDVANLQIPTGKVFFTPTGGSRAFMGNCTDFKLSNTLATKDHKRNYGGARTTDKTTITEKGAKATLTLEEIMPENLRIFALSDIVENSDGSFTLKGLSNTNFTGFLEVIGDNDDGPQVDWEGEVQFVPSGDFSLIKNDDDYNVIDIEATVTADSAGEFGEWTVRPPA
jgi:hypothetical protein